uniref:Bromodomain adjacent to zinc finger domain 2B n=1 Tax=Gasterosteus aculeatus aculeatus TaxID=481459 RepID=A0AAQ4NZ36_GASAC
NCSKSCHLRQVTGDERLNVSGSSNGFPVVSHPAFGLYTSSSGRSEFGGLGSLGLSALAAHSQFGTFPDWWRLSEAHTSGAGSFFPPLLGLHPIFASTFKGYDPTYLQSRSPGNKKRPTLFKVFHVLPLQSADFAKQAFDLRPKSQCKSHKNPASSSSLLTQHKSLSDIFSSHSLSLPHGNDTNLFLSHHLNGVTHNAVQDAPLALITKPRSHSSTSSSKPLPVATSPAHLMPINLSTCAKDMPASSASPLKSPSGLAHRPRKTSTPKSLHEGDRLAKTQASCPAPDVVRGSESDIHSSRDSDDSLGDDFDDDDEDNEDDIEDEDSASSLSGSELCRPMLRLSLNDMVLYVVFLLFFRWQRETRIRTVAGRLQGEVAYFAPCGKKLRQYPDVMKYLLRNGITEISRDNFSFSTKIQVGDFYETREGPEGLQWFLLAEEEIAPRIIAMDGRRSRCAQSERQLIGEGPGSSRWRIHPLAIDENNFQGVSDSKLLRKLEAQEIARQAAQIKMMRKLEKQAMAQAAKEARKQQAIMAAEERRKKREQMKIVKQQEKIKRIQQVRMEKELRAQQILEVLSVLCQERERRRQHMMLMKAVENRKKAEEKERLKKEKKDEKRLNKERKLELRRLELEKAKELKKPNEDMCLADHEALPHFSRIPGLVLPGSTFSECLMVLQFLRSFGKVLRLDMNPNTLHLSDLQEGLLNTGDSMGKVQDLLVNMLSAVVCDPGIPAGHKIALGDHVTNVGINRDNVSEILQIYMEGHCEQMDLAALALSLRTKAFQAHSPTQKASMLAFLVNELCCSKAVISEIDRNIDNITNLRKDKWVVEGKLRKLRSIHAKKTGKRESSVGGEDSHTFVTPTARNKCKSKEGDSEEEEDEDDTSEDQGEEEDDDEESVGTKGKKAEICEEEVSDASMEELEKQIEKTYKQQSQIRQKLFDSSHSLRSMTVGQDRYKRRYWVLPQCRGVFVEGMESGEGYEEAEKERKRLRTAAVMRIKEEEEEEQQEDTKKPAVSSSAQSTDGDTTTPEGQRDMDSLNLFLQKPGSFSKLSKLLEVAKMSRDVDPHYGVSAKVPPAVSYPSYSDSQTATGQQGLIDKLVTSVPSLLSSPQLGSPWVTCGPQSIDHEEQLSKMLMEKSNQWFSLLPRSPCDESSFTSGSSPPALSSSPLQTSATKPPSPISPASASCRAPTGTNNIQHSVSQQVKSGIHQSRLTWCNVTGMPTSPGLPVLNASLTPALDRSSLHVKGDGKKVFLLAHSNSVNKSGTPEQQSDKPECASFPSVEVANTQDYPSPQPIPEDMLCGWWRVADMEELHSLVKALHSRGIREKALQKQIQKHMEYTNHLKLLSVAIDVAELKKREPSENTVEGWCVEEQAMEVDISLLQQVEGLERKVVSASLQVKGWMHGEPQSEREDLVYHEHKLHASPAQEKKGQRETTQEELPGTVVRRPDNPLDIAVIRLAELERNIERRYFMEKGSEEEVAPGMRLWRKALGEVRSSAQLSLCIQQLQKSIAWERSIMKVHCQLCQKGDNEELLLLCDGCDKGCHTYCQIPRITTVPDGDWFCPTCVAKGRGQSAWSRKQRSRTAGGGKKGSEVKQNSNSSAVGELIKGEAASGNSAPKKATKELKKRKGDDSPPCSQTRHISPLSCVKKAKTTKDCNTDGLMMCRVLLDELEGQRDAWPFLTPVNQKVVPGYRKVIKKPMDFSTIREKLSNNQYFNLEAFIIDVNLVFDNCEKFNEDDSEIGQAGHRMRTFFDKRWAELLE